METHHPTQDEIENFVALSNQLLTLLFRNADKESILRIQRIVEALPAEDSLKGMLTESVHMTTAIKERFDHYQQRERTLNAVIETVQDLTAIRHTRHLLDTIVMRARKMVSSDLSFLLMCDSDLGDFHGKAEDGIPSGMIKSVQVGRDVDICGLVAKSLRPFGSLDYGKDSRFSHDERMDAVMRTEGVKSLLGLPLVCGTDFLGVLFVGERYERAFSAWDMVILSMLTAHASVTIRNAQLADRAQIALRRANEESARLLSQVEEIQTVADVHEQLSLLLARGAGLQEICDAIADLLHGYVVVLDVSEQQVCASSSKNVSHLFGAAEKLHDLIGQYDDKIHAALGKSRVVGRSISVSTSEHAVCRVSAVLGSRGLLGGFIALTATELDALGGRIFEQGALMIGIVLASQERSESTYREDAPAIVLGLLSSPQHDLARLSRLALRIGIDLAGPVCLAVIEVSDEKRVRILKKLKGVFQAKKILCEEIERHLVFLSGMRSVEEMRSTVQHFLSREIRETITGVVSAPVTDPATLPSVYKATTKCLASLKILGRGGSIFHQQELSLYAVLFDSQNTQNIEAFLSYAMGKLYTGDKNREGELARTLLAYLDHGHNASAAAKELGIHVNTFRQRLGAIDAILGDWDQQGRTLEMHVALRLWRLRQDGFN